MTVQRMDHVGVVVDDLSEATAFFAALGLERLGGGTVEGDRVDRIVGLEGVRSDFAMLGTPDGHGRLELIEFRTPASPDGDRDAPANVPGLRHLCFAVDDVDAAVARLQPRGGELVGELVRYGNSFRLCYLRGPAGIIVELAEGTQPRADS
jgi:catechol 2,3-dioxygenase-like lactoylglutathione lyase family enzyme